MTVGLCFFFLLNFYGVAMAPMADLQIDHPVSPCVFRKWRAWESTSTSTPLSLTASQLRYTRIYVDFNLASSLTIPTSDTRIAITHSFRHDGPCSASTHVAQHYGTITSLCATSRILAAGVLPRALHMAIFEHGAQGQGREVST
jgi:hypothetical protein